MYRTAYAQSIRTDIWVICLTWHLRNAPQAAYVLNTQKALPHEAVPDHLGTAGHP
jgi:hypothetical protein